MTQKVPESSAPLPEGKFLWLFVLVCDKQQQPRRYVGKFSECLQGCEVFALERVDLVGGLTGGRTVLDGWAGGAADETDGVVIEQEPRQG